MIASSHPTEEQENLQKRVAYYAAMVEAWIGTRMERDRTLVTLAAAGIGLLITILTAVGVSARWHLWLYGLSAIGFGTSIYTSLRVFERNAEAIEHALGIREVPPKLTNLDRTSRLSFALGTAFFVGLAIVSALGTTASARDQIMPDSTKGAPAKGPVLHKRSLDGIAKLKPPAAPTSGGAPPAPAQGPEAPPGSTPSPVKN
jgi:hypothetical protein